MFKILPLGDSLTQGSPDFPGGYRGPLRERLVQEGFAIDFVGSRTVNSEGLPDPEHEGHPGFRTEFLRTGCTTDHSSARPLAETLSTYRPDAILLLDGTNNLYFDAPEVAAEEIRRLAEIIFAYSNEVHLLLGTILPILPGPKPWNCVIPGDVTLRVQKYNLLLGGMVKKFKQAGHSVILVDLYPCCQGPGDLLADGVHPGQAAVRRMSEAWFQGLQSLIPGMARKP